ncbi:MAG: endolytic transglycosylase MltG [Oscillospiraceae bacterium]
MSDEMKREFPEQPELTTQDGAAPPDEEYPLREAEANAPAEEREICDTQVFEAVEAGASAPVPPASEQDTRQFGAAAPDCLSDTPADPPQQEPAGQPTKTNAGGKGHDDRRRFQGVRTFAYYVVILGVSLGLAAYIITAACDVFALNKQDVFIDVEISQNATLDEIADTLEEKGVIYKSGLFKLYTKFKKLDDSLQYGTYHLNARMTYDQILGRLQRVGAEDTIVKLTFWEGMTINSIADMLQDANVCSAQEFRTYLNTAELNYSFLDGIPKDENRFYRLEGYIFPDTYEFYEGEAVESVAAKFLSTFSKRVTEEYRDLASQRGMTLDQVITLASLVQSEASLPANMPLVASVFENRLQDQATYPNLQSDVTIHYVEREIKPYIDIADQAMFDAYNTYVCEGLPVGPVCNPGLAAIKAVLNPAKTNYFYFVTDVNDKYYFATTYEEHLRNCTTAENAVKTESSQGE